MFIVWFLSVCVCVCSVIPSASSSLWASLSNLWRRSSCCVARYCFMKLFWLISSPICNTIKEQTKHSYLYCGVKFTELKQFSVVGNILWIWSEGLCSIKNTSNIQTYVDKSSRNTSLKISTYLWVGLQPAVRGRRLLEIFQHQSLTGTRKRIYSYCVHFVVDDLVSQLPWGHFYIRTFTCTNTFVCEHDEIVLLNRSLLK